MSWRQIPPVVSPVPAGALVEGAATLLGLARERRAALELDITARFGGRATLTDSGTSALVLALRAARGATGCIAMPAYACIDLTAAAERADVRIRLYDLDPATLSPDLESLRGAMIRGVDAVVVAPLFGYPVDHGPIAQLGARHGVRVIEDAAQGAAGQLNGARIGTFGDYTVLSFGRGKGTTGGSGGAMISRVARAPEDRIHSLAPPARGVADVVGLAAQWLLARPALYRVPAAIPQLQLGEMVYHPAREPRAISAVASRLALRALTLDAGAVEQRRSNAALLLEASRRGSRLVPVQPVHGSSPGYLRFAGRSRDSVAAPVPALGIVRPYPVTLDEHPRTIVLLEPGEAAGPGAREIRDRLLALPTHARMSPGDVRALTRWLAT